MTMDLSEYPDIKKQFNDYGLSYLSTPPSSYYPTIVVEFFANYLAILEKECPKGQKVSYCKVGLEF